MRARATALMMFRRQLLHYMLSLPPGWTSTQALRLIARLGCAFNVLLLARPLNGEYKRVAGDNSSGSFPFPDKPQRIPGRVVGDHLIEMDMPSAISFLLISIFDRVLSSYARRFVHSLPSLCSSLCLAFLVRTTTIHFVT